MTAPLSQRRIPFTKRISQFFYPSNTASGPLELQILGKVLLHAALVGVAAGGLGTLFVFGCELMSAVMLGHIAGYHSLHAAGEHDFFPLTLAKFHPWLLLFMPAMGALVSGILCVRFAPEALGGGTGVFIDSFHHRRGVLRRRVPWIKLVASIFTLGTGGSGGREGPTMLMGAALGSSVARVLKLSDRERRILLVAGTAAGMSAVFRTPLGAAILAVEVLHRDDFESDALVPSVLASVVGYSVSIAFLGQGALFAHSEHFPFVPVHLPLYLLQAIFVSLGALLFLFVMRKVEHFFAGSRLPPWLRPAIGGLGVGAVALSLMGLLDHYTGRTGQGVGILTGGYGVAQVAVQGSEWLPTGWSAVQVLLLVAVVKMVATSLTVGSGGSAGDFGPSLVIGGLLGGAFGRAASLIFEDPRIDPGAFALVGMATFYGGIAHVPLAALVMTCELAGSYELLVPLMLSEGVAFVLLKNRTLYEQQLPTKRESPAHRKEMLFDVLREVEVRSVLLPRTDYITFMRKTSAREIALQIASADWQDTFPVLDENALLVGLVTTDILRISTTSPELLDISIADDLMTAPASIRIDQDLHGALETLLECGMRELPVIDPDGLILGFLDEAEITKAYHAAIASHENT